MKWLAIILAVALAAIAAVLIPKQGRQQTQIAALENQVAQLTAEKEALEETQAQVATATQSQDNLEVVRLRGEVASLRPLQKQVQQLQAENQQLKGSMQQLQQNNAEAAALRAQNQQLQGAMQAKAQADACIANLRTMEQAKIAWAQQEQRQPNDVPTDADLFGPGKPLPQRPVCPGGGQYNIGPVQARPTCTVPGHAY